MYLLVAVADLCLVDELSKEKYRDALHELWDNLVGKKMYLTGGLGAIPPLGWSWSPKSSLK
jgi:DUF1680 family protein